MSRLVWQLAFQNVKKIEMRRWRIVAMCSCNVGQLVTKKQSCFSKILLRHQARELVGSSRRCIGSSNCDIKASRFFSPSK